MSPNLESASLKAILPPSLILPTSLKSNPILNFTGSCILLVCPTPPTHTIGHIWRVSTLEKYDSWLGTRYLTWEQPPLEFRSVSHSCYVFPQEPLGFMTIPFSHRNIYCNLWSSIFLPLNNSTQTDGLNLKFWKLPSYHHNYVIFNWFNTFSLKNTPLH